MREVVIIEAERTAYSVDQIDSTLTVGELINILRAFNEDDPIYLSHDEGYSYGPVEYCNIGSRMVEEESDYNYEEEDK